MWRVTTKTLKVFLARNFHLTKSSKCNVVGSIKTSKIGDDISLENRPLKSFQEIPGPSSLPLIGTIHHFLPGGKFYKMDRQEITEKLYRLYGPIAKLNKPDILFLYDAESASQLNKMTIDSNEITLKIFKREEPLPSRPRIKLFDMYRQEHDKSIKIGALINSNGSEWRKVRSPANKAMLDPKFVSDSYSEVLHDIAKEAVARFGSLRDTKNMIPNLTQEVQLWALESSAMVALGRRLNCFRPDLPPDSREKQLLSLIQDVFVYIEKVDFRYDKYLFSGLFKKAVTTIAELESIIRHYINDAIKNLETKNDITPTCTLQKMIHQNMDIALPLAFDSLLGGVDTITQTTLHLLYCLGLNADKREKLREEILSGNNRKYLRACMKESSRLIPTILANGRITTKPYQLLGYEIPEGILVLIPHRIICLMESQFPRAQEFIPERWLVEKDHPLYYGNAHPYAYGPFGFGSRSCIGRRIAQMSMEALIVNMFKELDVKWEGPPPKYKSRTLNLMLPPFHFIFNNLK